MMIRAVAWIAIMLTALTFVPEGAHLFSLPNKIMLVEQDYFVAQTLYRGWSWFGIVLAGAIVANVAWALLARKQAMVCSLATAAAICLGVVLIVFFARAFPVNELTNNWTIAPENWQDLRAEWELAHAVNALITFVALGCAAAAGLVQHDESK
jgi:hypothetical protein